ncbi:MAG: selenobiotic family peptide radical SAM maturase [Chlorobiaceae bacterium]|nr:selenobiotic family peptide radical SAM maturase [Chlorobiaceae bacterium]
MESRRVGNRYRLADSLQMEARGDGIHLTWQEPGGARIRQAMADMDDLLGLKIVTGHLELKSLADTHDLPLSRFYRLLSFLDRKGILKAPSTLLRRDPELFGRDLGDELFTLAHFGLQWHITNACDLHCRHCYDRSQRSPMTGAQALRALDQFQAFCHEHWVVGHIAFTGGNPFLYPGFFDLYREAVTRGFEVEILGNPVSGDQLEKLCSIRPPGQFQVSLEGRRSCNDRIRGEGSFDRVMAFLDLLKSYDINSGVMLTLHEENYREVLPLVRLLEGLTDAFNFTRLSQTGEGAALRQLPPEKYKGFLDRYIACAASSHIAACKESLINLAFWERGEKTTVGCTGTGCGIAFDGVILLPDGEVHGCRKLPSRMGNLWEQTLEEIYFSPAGAALRRGMRACDGCPVRAVCGGCIAASTVSPSGFEDTVDPCCWRLWGK